MSRFIAKSILLEQSKRQIIWDGGSTYTHQFHITETGQKKTLLTTQSNGSICIQ